MQKAQSDLKRSEEQIRLKDQEIYKMKRKVRHIYFILSRLSSRFSSSTLRSKFQIPYRSRTGKSRTRTRRVCERRSSNSNEFKPTSRNISTEDVWCSSRGSSRWRLIIISVQKELENLRIAGKISKIRKTFLKEKVWFISHNHSKFYIRISQKFLADYGLIWVGNSTNSPKYPETILK